MIGIAGVGIEVLLAVKALVAPTENVPAQTGGNRQLRRGMVSVFDKRRVVRVGFGAEDGSVELTARLPCR